MALTPERIDAIVSLVGQRFAAGETLDAVLRAVRDAHPDLSNVTGAHASVMTDDPYREEPGFNLYLVDKSNHCWVITGAPEQASGIVIAQADQDD